MKKAGIIKSLSVLMLTTCMLFSAGAAHASSENPSVPNVETQQLNEHQVQLEFTNYTFETNDAGEVEAINSETGDVEQLPGSAIDANGNEVTVKYGIENDHTLIATAVYEDSSVLDQTEIQATSSGAKCWLGIVGSGVGGGLAGAAAGSAVPIIGTAAGAVSGAMAGNAVGTATYCL